MIFVFSDCLISFLFFNIVFFDIFIDYAITVVPFPPLHSTPSCPRPPSHIPPYSSCPWVILISSLASTFPTLFLPSPCLFSTCHLCYLFSVPFPPLSPSQSPIDNPPCDLYFLLIMLLQSSQFFPPLSPLHPDTPTLQHSPHP